MMLGKEESKASPLGSGLVFDSHLEPHGVQLSAGDCCCQQCIVNQNCLDQHEMKPVGDIITDKVNGIKSNCLVEVECVKGGTVSRKGTCEHCSVEVHSKDNHLNSWRENDKKMVKSESGVRTVAKAPDGGWGWVIVFCSFLNLSIMGGSFIGFSILYLEFVSLFDTTKAVAGWIGSIYMAAGSILGIFFSVAVERYGSRVVCIVGSLIACCGYFISAFTRSLLELYIFFGVIAGSGVGMISMSSLVIIQHYFDRQRALATSFALSGFSAGSLAAGPLIRFLLDTYCLRGTLIIFSGILLQICVFGSLLRPLRSHCTKQRHQHPVNLKQQCAHSQELVIELKTVKGGCGENYKMECSDYKCRDLQNSMSFVNSKTLAKEQKCCAIRLCSFIGRLFVNSFDFSLLRRIPFLLYVISTFLMHIGITAFFQHTPSRAASFNIEPHKIAWLPTVAAIATGISRIILGFVANLPCTDRMLQYGISLSLSAAMHMMTPLATTFEAMIAYGVVQGTINGGFFCIMSTILVDLNGVEHVARSMSMWSLSLGAGTLISTPFAGFMFDVTGSYDIPFIVTGAMQFVGGLLGITIYLMNRHNCTR